MNQRVKRIVIGSAMIGVLAAGAVTGSGVLAVEGTPTSGNSGMVDDHSAERAAEYETFITLLAGNLGVDATTADTAMRQTLLDLVDQAVIDGVITQEQADQVKTEISSPDFSPNVRGLLRGAGPMGDHMRGRDGHGHDGDGHGGMKGEDHDGDSNSVDNGDTGASDDDADDTSTPDSEGTTVSG